VPVRVAVSDESHPQSSAHTSPSVGLNVDDDGVVAGGSEIFEARLTGVEERLDPSGGKIH